MNPLFKKFPNSEQMNQKLSRRLAWLKETGARLFLGCLAVCLSASAANFGPPESDTYSYLETPLLRGVGGVISAPSDQFGFQLHSYLQYHDGKFWCMWSRGYTSEDANGQEVAYSTSIDGVSWSKPQILIQPQPGKAVMARGFWTLGGDLYALVAQFRGPGVLSEKNRFDKNLELMVYQFREASNDWKFTGLKFENAVNNYPPVQLSDGNWIFPARDQAFDVHAIIGKGWSAKTWRQVDVVGRYEIPEFAPDEPVIDPQAHGTLLMLFRNNGPLRFIHQSTSLDGGHTWTRPKPTGIPSAPSKFFLLRLSNGAILLLGNFDSLIGRKRMHAAIVDDQFNHPKFAKLDLPGQLVGGGIANVQYPHAIEVKGRVYVAYSTGKYSINVFNFGVEDLVNTMKDHPSMDTTYIELVCRYVTLLCHSPHWQP